MPVLRASHGRIGVTSMYQAIALYAENYGYLYAYNDGRSDGRMYCRDHNAAERAHELERCKLVAYAVRGNKLRYYDGYTEILSSWVDGIGA